MTVASPKETLAAGRERFTGANEKGLPDALRPFFWDVDFDGLCIEGNSFFIISRLLEHGDEPSARFLLQAYSEDEIIKVLKTSRALSKRSRGFWMIYFRIEGEPCSPKQFPPACGTYSEEGIKVDFEEADHAPDPMMIWDKSWAEVKESLKGEVRRIAHKLQTGQS